MNTTFSLFSCLQRDKTTSIFKLELIIFNLIKKIMFGLFKKDPIEKLQTQYRNLLESSFKLSTTDRKSSDLKRAEAEEVLRDIERLQAK